MAAFGRIVVPKDKRGGSQMSAPSHILKPA
jgi:hypothetical protein